MGVVSIDLRRPGIRQVCVSLVYKKKGWGVRPLQSIARTSNAVAAVSTGRDVDCTHSLVLSFFLARQISRSAVVITHCQH